MHRQKGLIPGAVPRWHIVLSCGCQRASRRNSLELAAHREEATVSSVPSLPSPCSALSDALIHLHRNPRCLRFQGCTVFEEKQLQSFLRPGERREKFHMVAITAGTAGSCGDSEGKQRAIVPTWTGSASPSRCYLISAALRGSTQHPLTCYLREPCGLSALGRVEGSEAALLWLPKAWGCPD